MENFICPLSSRCGGCDYTISYAEELYLKQEWIDSLFRSYCYPRQILAMESYKGYRNKVQAVLGFDKKGQICSGLYRQGTHMLVPVKDCYLEFEEAKDILHTVRTLMKSLKLLPYDEDRNSGDLRHVLLRKGHNSGQILVVLIFGNSHCPKKKEFAKALVAKHPYITSIVSQVNNEQTSMVLSEEEFTLLHGKGYIEDTLCGLKFRISPSSFYQINSKQTEVLYNTAITLAQLKPTDRVLDAYCGTGTIGLVSSKYVKEVVGIELNEEAVKDAVINAKENGITNASFVAGDASLYCKEMAKAKESFDVVFLDPPRSGSDERFLASLIKMAPRKIVYISCNPVTQERDLDYIYRFSDYTVKYIQPVDNFPRTTHVETVVLLSRVEK